MRPHTRRSTTCTTHTCSYNCTSVPVHLSHCHAEMMALGIEPEGGTNGDLLSKQHKNKGAAAPQSCWNVKACLEKAAYKTSPAFPFPQSPAPRCDLLSEPWLGGPSLLPAANSLPGSAGRSFLPRDTMSPPKGC